MQHYKPVLSIVKRLGLIEPKVLLRPFVSVATTNAPSTELSNRQKFNQIAPPVKLYEKLEKLGFGTLLKTKRFAGVHKQKAKRDQQRLQHTERVGPPPEPKYAVSINLIYNPFFFFFCNFLK